MIEEILDPFEELRAAVNALSIDDDPPIEFWERLERAALVFVEFYESKLDEEKKGR